MTDQTPLFSVVIPTFNRAHVIHYALSSVFSQTLTDFEVIVVDDGSRDNIDLAVSNFDDPRLRLVRQPNGGGGRARNTGINHARGRYVAFLDSDDTFLPHHLETMAEIVKGHDNIVAYSQVVVDRDNGKTFLKPPRAMRPGENMAEYLCCARGFVQTSTLVVPAFLARKVLYREGMRFGQDTDFAIRLSLENCQFVMASKPGAIWNDAFDPSRVSSLRKGASNLPWIEEMRHLISPRAYHGYRGWHIAKGVAKTNKFSALTLYLTALRQGSYSLGLALVIACQIFIPDEGYRRLTNGLLRLKKSDKREAVKSTV